MTPAGSAARSGALGGERLSPLNDEAATSKLGAAVAAELVHGDVVALFGDLGAGKTTFARGVLRALGHGGVVPSPTFTLVQHYEMPGISVAHFDLYRLGDVGELHELGLDDARHDGTVLIEWPEIAAHALPSDRLEVHLEYAGVGRIARLATFGSWVGRLARLVA
ncbi:MAG: tRNA (adenosine(37)-N6)-threonylcarbamoyltransferase complex ATPase subunit type 1 TsaE [Alphaproteobacteria bacterium]